MKIKLTLLTAAILFFAGNQITSAQTLTVNLVPSSYNGHHLSCWGGSDGYLMASCLDGTPPYQWQWSNEEQTANIYNLAPGYYQVVVTDANNATGMASITLREPSRVTATLTPLTYSNGRHLSCHFCADGRVNTSVSGGEPPYGYNWSDGGFTDTRTNMEAGNWQVIITDLNGCELVSSFGLNAPDREDWMNVGNSGTNPAVNFIGTTDTKDLVFKTNSTTRLKILANGKLNISGLARGYTTQLLIDSSGNLVSKGPNPSNNYCHANYFPLPFPSWQVEVDNIDNQGGFMYLCADDIKVGIGTLTKKNKLDVAGNLCIGSGFAGSVDAPTDGLLVKGNSFFNGNIEVNGHFNGKVVIGDGLNINTSYDYGLYVANGILAEKVKVAVRTSNDWSDKVFHKNYKLSSLSDLETYIKKYHHLPEIPSAEEVVKSGINLAEMNAKLLQKIEELTLYVIQQQKEIDQLKTK